VSVERISSAVMKRMCGSLARCIRAAPRAAAPALARIGRVCRRSPIPDTACRAPRNRSCRHCLNGILFVAEGKSLTRVATDGHRLALAQLQLGERPGVKSDGSVWSTDPTYGMAAATSP
jgi:hypothetical protein